MKNRKNRKKRIPKNKAKARLAAPVPQELGKVERRKNGLVLHPFLFAAYSVLFLFAYNVKFLAPYEIYGYLTISVLLSAGFYFVLNLFYKKPEKSALITTLLVFVFFNYGRLYEKLSLIKVDKVQVITHKYLVIILALLLAIAFYYIITSRKMHLKLNSYLNVLSVILFSLIFIQSVIGVIKYKPPLFKGHKAKNEIKHEKSGTASSRYPDIYYIITDGHARLDRLLELYGYDESKFINELKERGFYVASKSTPNYQFTWLSLACSLNMGYVQDLFHTTDGGYARGKIPNSKVVKFLREKKYNLICFNSGFIGTENMPGFKNYYPAVSMGEKFNTLRYMFVRTSMLVLIEKYVPEKDKDTRELARFRNHILYTIDNLPVVAKYSKSPKFVFAHMMSPHPPFVFNENGPTDEWKGTDGATPASGNKSKLSRDDYKKGYIGELKYIDKLLIKTIDGIIENSQAPPVIILQSDHGPGVYFHFDDPEKAVLKDRFSILNAYYTPGMASGILYDDISPVNSFRVIFNQYFGQKYQLLEDKSYYVPFSKPEDYTDITDEVRN